MLRWFFAFWFVSLLGQTSAEWERTELIWNFGIRNFCDVGVETSPNGYFKTLEYPFDRSQYVNFKKNDLVWLRQRFLKDFYFEVLPVIECPVILVLSDGDESFPKNCGLKGDEVEDLLNNPNILHVFTQNYDYHGPSKKVSPIPIGIDFHSIAYKGGYWGEQGSPIMQERLLCHLMKGFKPTSQRKKRAFIDFQHSESMRASFERYKEFNEDRTSIFKKLESTGLVDYTKRISRTKLWRIKGEYAFSISPWGNGLDCHRTWEDLALGCIVIVKTSSLDPLYEGLPVVIVKDWDEITERNLSIWLDKFQDASQNPLFRKRLTNRFWINKILAERIN
ncbi:MAG: hypothetical protein ACOYK9_02795 [Chlamydiia bacterium]